MNVPGGYVGHLTQRLGLELVCLPVLLVDQVDLVGQFGSPGSGVVQPKHGHVAGCDVARAVFARRTRVCLKGEAVGFNVRVANLIVVLDEPRTLEGFVPGVYLGGTVGIVEFTSSIW